MTIKKTFFAFKIVAHAFNGSVVTVEGVGVIEQGTSIPLTEETILACINLGQVLRKIVVTNGYTIANGKLIKVEMLPSKLAQKI